MRTVLGIFFCCLLLGLYGVVAFNAAHPQVSSEYRAYYLERTAQDWRPVRYEASLQNGVSLAQKGLPDSVEATQGLSLRQPWGRWAISYHGSQPALLLNTEVVGNACVLLNAHPDPALRGERVSVVLGSESHPLAFSSPKFAPYALDFSPAQPAKRLAFHFENPSSRNPLVSLGLREQRIAISEVKILPGSCAALTPNQVPDRLHE